MKFRVEPKTLYKHQYRYHGKIRNHVFGFSDETGVLEVPGSDPFIKYVKAKYEAIPEAEPQEGKIIPEPQEIAPTTSTQADTGKQKEGAKKNVNHGKTGHGGRPKANGTRKQPRGNRSKQRG